MIRARRPGERGVALLLVLWIFMVLGVLALDFARYMRDDAMAAVNFAEEARGYYLALAGVNRAIYAAQRAQEQGGVTRRAGGTEEDGDEGEEEAGESDFVVDGQWHEGDFAGGRYAVRMSDEAGRLSLNRADEPTLTRVVTNLMQGGDATAGLDRRESNAVAEVVHSILDWRDGDDLERLHGAESEYYLGRRVPYRAKNGWFDSPEELLLVRGVTPALYYGQDGRPGLRDIFSVNSRRDKVSLEAAPAAVLQVLLGIDAAAAAELVAQRSEDGASFLEVAEAQLRAINPNEDLIHRGSPVTVMIEARGDTLSARNQSHVAVILDLASEATDGPRVRRWLDRAPWEGGLPGGGASPPEDGGS